MEPKRIHWRWLLSAAQLVLFVLALAQGCPYILAAADDLLLPSEPATQVRFHPQFIDGPISLPEQLALGINFPAEVPAVLLTTAWQATVPRGLESGRDSELTMNALQSLLIPLLWYAIGWSIETGFIGAYRPNSRSVRVTLRVLQLVLGTLAVLSISMIVAARGITAPLLFTALASIWLAFVASAIHMVLARPAPSTAAAR